MNANNMKIDIVFLLGCNRILGVSFEPFHLRKNHKEFMEAFDEAVKQPGISLLYKLKIVRGQESYTLEFQNKKRAVELLNELRECQLTKSFGGGKKDIPTSIEDLTRIVNERWSDESVITHNAL
jgi:hypothetical protein